MVINSCVVVLDELIFITVKYFNFNWYVNYDAVKISIDMASDVAVDLQYR